MIPPHVYAHALATFFAPIAEHLRDPAVSEVMINGPYAVYVERHGRIEQSAARFEDDAALLAALRVLAQYVDRPLDAEHPILEARLPDGSRVEAVLAPVAKDGAHIAIRRFSPDRLSCEGMVASGALSEECLQWLRALVESRHNIVISGGAGTGKTSLLNVLSSFIGDEERTVVLEDGRELSPRSAHVVQLEARPADQRGRGGVSIRALLHAALRMRPDRIVVGEIRDGAALDLVQAMTSGHAGCLATLHASHPVDALARLETMALMAQLELPLRALRGQVSAAVDVVVQLDRLRSGLRVVTHVAEVTGLDQRGAYRVQEVFMRRAGSLASAGELVLVGCSQKMRERIARHAVHLPSGLSAAREDQAVGS